MLGLGAAAGAETRCWGSVRLLKLGLGAGARCCCWGGCWPGLELGVAAEAGAGVRIRS